MRLPLAGDPKKRDLAIACGFALLVQLPFLGKAYHMDEPFFLAAARHILQDPLHPFGFEFNWYGRSAPVAEIIHTPPLLPYLLAGALKLTGGSEGLMRLAFLPFDLAACAALCLLASRFLARPLLPVLIAVAGPAYLINMNHLMAEKPAAAFGFFSLHSLVRGIDARSAAWYWASAGLLAAAVMSKYHAAFLLLPALAYAWHRGTPARRLWGYMALALGPLAAALAWDALSGGTVLKGAWSYSASGAASPWSA